MADLIAVKGLREFQRSLKKMDSDLPKALRIGFNGVSDLIIGKAQPLIPRRTGKAAASLKAKSTQKAVRISMGGKRAPYMPWLDYGGRVGPAKSVRRPFIKEGRYLYPTLNRERGQIQSLLQATIVGLAKDAGLDAH